MNTLRKLVILVIACISTLFTACTTAGPAYGHRGGPGYRSMPPQGGYGQGRLVPSGTRKHYNFSGGSWHLDGRAIPASQVPAHIRAAMDADRVSKGLPPIGGYDTGRPAQPYIERDFGTVQPYQQPQLQLAPPPSVGCYPSAPAPRYITRPTGGYDTGGVLPGYPLGLPVGAGGGTGTYIPTIPYGMRAGDWNRVRRGY